MNRLSASVRAVARTTMRALPESFVLRLLRARGAEDVDVPPPVDIVDAPARLLVAPANYAGQGRAWARAADGLDGVRSVNLEVVRPGGFSFAADFRVSDDVYVWSRRWAAEHAAAVEGRFTHVLVEAERSILGRTCGFDLRKEAAWLERRRISRAYASHGSDLRLPSRHADLDRWSPFRDLDWELIPALEENARANAAFLEEQGCPVFVSSPELLLDAPGAAWLPVVIDPARWRALETPLSTPRPTVFHAPTSPRAKGTTLVAPVMEALDAERLICYRPAAGVQADRMRQLIVRTDIVLDQFRVGSYGVAACEAMAAGRVVIGHVSEQVRSAAANAAGMPLPIVEADPASVGHVVRDVVAQPERYRELAATGPDFIARVHDGTYSGLVLSRFLR